MSKSIIQKIKNYLNEKKLESIESILKRTFTLQGKLIPKKVIKSPKAFTVIVDKEKDADSLDSSLKAAGYKNVKTFQTFSGKYNVSVEL